MFIRPGLCGTGDGICTNTAYHRDGSSDRDSVLPAELLGKDEVEAGKTDLLCVTVWLVCLLDFVQKYVSRQVSSIFITWAGSDSGPILLRLALRLGTKVLPAVRLAVSVLAAILSMCHPAA